MGDLYYFHVDLELACSLTKRRMGFDVIDEICMYMNVNIYIYRYMYIIHHIKSRISSINLFLFNAILVAIFQHAGVVFNPVTVGHLVGRLLKIFSTVNVRVDSESKDRKLQIRNVSVVFFGKSADMIFGFRISVI